MLPSVVLSARVDRRAHPDGARSLEPVLGMAHATPWSDRPLDRHGGYRRRDGVCWPTAVADCARAPQPAHIGPLTGNMAARVICARPWVSGSCWIPGSWI